MRIAHIIDKFEEFEDMIVVEANSILDETELEGVIREIEVRVGGNLKNKAIYLPNPDDYNYEVVLDNAHQPCLLVTKK